MLQIRRSARQGKDRCLVRSIPHPFPSRSKNCATFYEITILRLTDIRIGKVDKKINDSPLAPYKDNRQVFDT
jgi:hypothetical protein